MTEYRMIMAGVVGLCALAAAAGVWPAAGVVATVLVAGLGACSVIAAVDAAVRRERRIRDRAGATHPGPTAAAVSLVPAEAAS